MMITAAAYEDMMQMYVENIKNGAPLAAEKAVEDTIDVLKQFGYDAGAKLFEQIMYETVKGNVIKSLDI